jgi:MFS family permease
MVSTARYAAPNTAPVSAADALYRRIGWRVMPVLFAAYIIAYVDRVNVSFAELQMMGDLKFSESVYGLGAGIFFLGYFLFEVPSNLMLHKVGARAWICRVLVTWGIISGCTALVRTPWQFYTVRSLLGVAESGFFPGMILYLTYWFPSQRRAQMVAILLAGSAVSGIVGGPVSGYIMRYVAGDGSGSSSSRRCRPWFSASSLCLRWITAWSRRSGSPRRTRSLWRLRSATKQA